MAGSSTITREMRPAEALEQLAAIPPAGSAQRDFWLVAAMQHGFCLDGHHDSRGNIYEADENTLLKLMSEARKQGQRDALTGGITAGIDAAIRGIDATILNVGSECSRRGIQDPETGEVPCEGEEDRGCACSEALELGARLIKNLRTCDVAKIAALATGGAR